MNQPKFFISRRSRLPKYRINKNNDFYFFPMFPAQGIACSFFEKKISYNAISWERVFTGKNSIIMKLLDWEKPMSAYDKIQKKIIDNPDDYTKQSVFNKNIKIGTYYVGKVISNNQSTTFMNRKSFIKQKVNFSLSVYFTNPWVWDSKRNRIRNEFLYLFFRIPEFDENDLFYISSINITLNQFGRYHSHVVNFASLSDKLETIGIFIDQKIQYAPPGENPILPEVNKVQIRLSNEFSEDDDLFFQEGKLDSQGNKAYQILENTKQVYVNKFYLNNTSGIKNIQFEFEGLTALISINVVGYIKEKNSWDNYKKQIVNRSIPILLHKNNVPIPTPLQKTKQYNDNMVLLGNWLVYMRYWFQSWKQDQGLFFNPKASRDEQGVVESADKTWTNIFANLNSGSAASNIQFDTIMAGYQNLVLNQFSKENSDGFDYDAPNKKILPENTKTFKTNLASFLNLNQFLLWNLDQLDVGIYQLKNTKGYVGQIMNDVFAGAGILTGLFSSFLGSKSATPIRSGLTLFNQIATRLTAWLPDELYTQKNTLKVPGAINFAISKEFIEHLKASMPVYSNGKINPAFIPFDLFKDGNWNAWANIIGTNNLNQTFNFELSEVVELFNKKRSTLENAKTIDLIRGTHQLNFKHQNELVTHKSDSEFVIQMLEIKCLGFRNVKVSFLDANNKIKNYFQMATQQKFTGNSRDITSRIFLDWSIDNNISLEEKFDDNWINKQEREYFYLDDLNDKIAQANTLEKLKNILDDKLNQKYTFPETNSNSWNVENYGQQQLKVQTFELKSFFKNIKDSGSFWSILKNNLIVDKKAILLKYFKKIEFNILFFKKYILQKAIKEKIKAAIQAQYSKNQFFNVGDGFYGSPEGKPVTSVSFEQIWDEASLTNEAIWKYGYKIIARRGGGVYHHTSTHKIVDSVDKNLITNFDAKLEKFQTEKIERTINDLVEKNNNVFEFDVVYAFKNNGSDLLNSKLKVLKKNLTLISVFRGWGNPFNVRTEEVDFWTKETKFDLDVAFSFSLKFDLTHEKVSLFVSKVPTITGNWKEIDVFQKTNFFLEIDVEEAKLKQ